MKKVLILLTGFLLGCSGISIKGVQSTDSFSIAKYKSFNFLDVDTSGDGLGPNQQSNLELIKTAITNEMKAKGVEYSTSNPDLLVNIGIVVSNEVQTRETSFTNPADRMAYMGQRNYHWESSEVAVGTYRQGTVTLDLVEASSKNQVWQGSATGVVPEKQKNVPEVINVAMGKLFEKIN